MKFILYFTGVDLMDGYLKVGESIIETEKELLKGSASRGTIEKEMEEVEVEDWSARDITECLQDADKLRLDLIESFSNRKNCLSSIQIKFSLCLDFVKILETIIGTKNDDDPSPYNELDLAVLGDMEFREVYQYISKCSHVIRSNLRFDPIMATRVHDRIKAAIASTVWGANFSSVGVNMLKIVDGDEKGKCLGDAKLVLNLASLSVEQFCKVQISEHFTLETVFQIKLVGLDTVYTVSVSKSVIWEAVYTNSSFFNVIGREGCFILDFAYNIGGSEAIAETYFGIMKSQMKDNQDPETTNMRTLIKMCLPEPSCCPNAIESISNL